MIRKRPSGERGHFDHGWLDTYHTFSFGEYHDVDHMGFRHLRVINEDRVQPAHGFETHSHWDMEIVTVVLDGALQHRDSMGNGSVIRRGDVQRMSAGTGVTHSEFNHSDSDLVHFLQIWIVPDRKGLQPSYEQRRFPDEARRGKLRLIVSPEGREETIAVHQNVAVFDCSLDPGGEVRHAVPPGRHAWLQVTSGALETNGMALVAGDGAAVSEESALQIRATQPSDFLLFDLA